MPLVKYTLLLAPSGIRLSEAVNRHLDEGWDLYGDPFTHSTGFYQAMSRQAADTKKSVELKLEGSRALLRALLDNAELQSVAEQIAAVSIDTESKLQEDGVQTTTEKPAS